MHAIQSLILGLLALFILIVCYAVLIRGPVILIDQEDLSVCLISIGNSYLEQEGKKFVFVNGKEISVNEEEVPNLKQQFSIICEDLKVSIRNMFSGEYMKVVDDKVISGKESERSLFVISYNSVSSGYIFYRDEYLSTDCDSLIISNEGTLFNFSSV